MGDASKDATVNGGIRDVESAAADKLISEKSEKKKFSTRGQTLRHFNKFIKIILPSVLVCRIFVELF